MKKMASNEVRKDYLLNRWVVIAKERKKRPTDFIKKEISEKDGDCPFCPGNEKMTPPAILVYVSNDGKLEKKQDRDDFRYKNWLVRVIPNLYPGFSPPTSENVTINKCSNLIDAVGHHEVFIESPCHNEHLRTARLSQIVYVLEAYLDRLSIISKKSYVRHIVIFRNHGRDAGASLSHPHTQLIASPIIPPILEEELKASRDYWKKNQTCIFCDVLKEELNGPRFIWENNSFGVFAPFASVNPMEFWVVPKRHNSNMLRISKNEIEDLAEIMRLSLGGLGSLLNNPPYNFGFHTVLSEDNKNCYHWHLEVYPRLAIWAGLEKSTGMYINAVSPEVAAIELQLALDAEKSLM
jgi:UDPglucose--hexose-1-phosphate uridylyltransferase